VYLELAADVRIAATTDLLTALVVLDGEHSVFVQSDGRYFPAVETGRAEVFITIDGAEIGNRSRLDWGPVLSNNPVQHCFNSIGLARLAAGEHTFCLRVRREDADYFVGAGSNLSILIDPAPFAAEKSLSETVRGVDIVTGRFEEGDSLQTVCVLSIPGRAGAAAVALASGVCQNPNPKGPYGDAMWGIYLDGAFGGRDLATWSVNDLFRKSELTAPMYVHAFLPGGAGAVSLEATEFPLLAKWEAEEHEIRYDVLAGGCTKLIVLGGGLSVCGRASSSTPGKEQHIEDFQDIGGTSRESPPLKTWQLVAAGTVAIPPDHNGIVFFTAKARFQGDSADLGGFGRLRIKVDEEWRGSLGIQQLKRPNCISQRTACASYLATGTAALSPGSHAVEAWAKADGSFKHLSVHREAILIWFD